MKKHLIFVFLIIVISASHAFAHREDCDVWDVDVTGFSEVELLFDRVYGFAQTEIEATVSGPPSYCFDYEFYAAIESEFEGPNVYSSIPESGKPDATIVEVEHDDVEAEKGTYCVTSNHQYGGSFTWNNHKGEDILVILTGDGGISSVPACITIDEEPTPTPTPTPTPGCIESLEGSLPPCPLPIQVEVRTVGFAGDYAVLKYPAPGTLISDPTWTRGSSDNSENVVAYKKGTETSVMKLSASFALATQPPPGQALNITVRVKNGGNVVATASSPVSVTGTTFSISDLSMTAALETTPSVKKGNYTFAWEVSENGQNWRSAGSSEHIIYWTFGDVVEPPSCSSQSVQRDCLFVNNGGNTDWPGLYDRALEKAIGQLPPGAQTPDQIAKALAFNIDDQNVYNPSNPAVDQQHPLSAYNVAQGVQCSVNANLLRGLLRSIGINNSEVIYLWGGSPDNMDKRETVGGGSTYGYKTFRTSVSTGGMSEFYYSLQAIRPESNEGASLLYKDPHFTFHAMVKLFDEPDGGTNNLNSKYYDPSYAKRLQANPTRYSDYPYVNSNLMWRKSANLDDPTNHRFVENDATKPYVVRALRLNAFCLPNSRTCDPNLTKLSRRTLSYLVASLPKTSVFDGQGASTFSVWRPSDGIWYTRNAYDNSYRYSQFGQNGDKLMPGDYDGDGLTDYAVFRPSNSTVYIFESDTETTRTFAWNSPSDKPAYGDFDGDGKNDIAFYTPESRQWYVNRSSDGVTYSSTLGNNGGLPVSGDFDGDGKTDIAVYTQDRWGTWLWMGANGEVAGQETGGGSTDIPVPGDYDGDGKTDFALYRPSNHYWQILYSAGGASQFYLGVTGDIPAPGDYDGDGKTDVALWSPSNGHWLVVNSNDGTTREDFWGGQAFGDIPVGAALY